MEMNLQPTAAMCAATGTPFAAGQRVTSFLVRDPATGAILRQDLSEAAAAGFAAAGPVVCRWTQGYKPRREGEDAGRAMKLTAENLFLTLADPATERTSETTRLVQFLALLLERKKLLRPRGRTPDGERSVYEHVRTKQPYEVPVGDLTPEFFVQVQSQLDVLVGGVKPPTAPTQPAPAAG